MILEQTSGNSSGTTTCGAGVIHGAVLREVPQCSRGLHPIKSLGGLAVYPQSDHHSLIQKKSKKFQSERDEPHKWDTAVAETLHQRCTLLPVQRLKNVKWRVKAHSSACLRDKTRVHEVGVPPAISLFYGSELQANNILFKNIHKYCFFMPTCYHNDSTSPQNFITLCSSPSEKVLYRQMWAPEMAFSAVSR